VTERTSGSPLVGRDVVLSIAGLSAIAFAQPLLDLLGRNPAFFVAHDLGRGHILLLAGAVVVGVPLCLAALTLGVHRLHRPTGRVVHHGMIGALAGVATLVGLRLGAGDRLPGVVEVAVAFCVAALAAVAHHRAGAVRSIVRMCALAVPAVLVLFLLGSPVRALVMPAQAAHALSGIPADGPPIVFVIFDELPLAALLDTDGRIDAEAYPAFAQLAGDATLHRNVAAAHSSTAEAVPALLSGRYSPVSVPPNAASHPHNLFALLGDVYQPHALEPLTDLCGRPCAHTRTSAVDVRAALRDLVVVQQHLVVPDDFAGGLPPLDTGWRDFGGGQDLDRDVFLAQARHALAEDTPGDFAAFVAAVQPSQRPGLHVLHSLLPHRPWRYLPDGRRHMAVSDPATGEDGWTTLPWPRAQSLQLLHAQLQLTDRLLGDLLEHLRQVGMYDDTLLVVAADHGVSLVPGTPTRTVTAENVADIAAVPLLIKAPGQQHGGVSDVPLSTVDVVPTVLDLMGLDPPPGVDGRPANATASDSSHRRFVDSERRQWRVGNFFDRVAQLADERRQLFAADGAFDLFSLRPPGTPDLVGRRVPDDVPRAGGLRLRLRWPNAYADVDTDGPVVPASVYGDIAGVADDPLTIAVAVNGRVRAVTRTEVGHGPPGRFRALVSPDAFVDGTNTVEVLLVGAGGALRRIPHR